MLRAHSCEDGLIIAQGSASYSCVAIDWDLGETARMSEKAVLEIIHGVREKSLRIPIFLLSRGVTTGNLPMSVVREVREYVNLIGETPNRPETDVVSISFMRPPASLFGHYRWCASWRENK